MQVAHQLGAAKLLKPAASDKQKNGRNGMDRMAARPKAVVLNMSSPTKAVL